MTHDIAREIEKDCWGEGDPAVGLSELHELLAGALKLADRREHLGRNMPRCPKCDTKQVQLVSYSAAHAEWKCRHCKNYFLYEPGVS